MGKLIDLARGLAGEVSLHGRLGRWILSVAAALDDGAASPDYGIAKKGAALAVIGQGDKLVLELPGPIRGITYQETEGNWILTPGKTYLLHAEGYFTSFTDPVNGFVDITWVDDSNARIQSAGLESPSARFDTPNSSGSISMIYTVPAGATLSTVRLYCILATGTADMVSGFFSANVTEIPG